MDATVTTRCIQTTISSSPSSTETSQPTDQKIAQELSPDSGNGEELDEFDPLKTSPKCSDSKDDDDVMRSLHDLQLSSLECFNKGKIMIDHPRETPQADQANEERDRLINDTTKEKVTVSDIAESERDLELIILSENNDENRPSTITTSFISQNGAKDSIVHYSDAFSHKDFSSSILTKCGSSLQCGPFTGACRPIPNNKRVNVMNGPFSLPEGNGLLNDEILNTVTYQLNCDKTKAELLAIPNVEVGQESTCTNVYLPGCYSNYHSRLMRRYTSPEVVMKQPISGGLLTTSDELMISPQRQCACVNPGTSHACASRPTHKSSSGVLNPLFGHGNSGTCVTFASMPSTPRKYSLDQNYLPRDLSLPEFPLTPLPSVIPICQKSGTQYMSVSALHPDCELLLPQPSPPATASSDELSTHCPLNTDANSSTIPQEFSRSTSSTTTFSSLSGESLDPLSYKDLGKDLPSLNAMAKILGPMKSNMKPPVLTSPDWFSFLTPSQESYTQKLFTPGDLQDELLYPSPYGVASEVYQNVNAQEADFVLHKPNRKPRTEPLPSPLKSDLAHTSPKSTVGQVNNPLSLPTSKINMKSAQSPPAHGESTINLNAQKLQVSRSPVHMAVSPARIIEPLATEDEEALKEGAKESRKLSLSERRRTSLEKIYIPKAVEPKSVLDVKIDNFDRDEYVNYKKTLGKNDILIAEYPILPCTAILQDLTQMSKTRKKSRLTEKKRSESDSSRNISTITDHLQDVKLDGSLNSPRTRKLSHNYSLEEEEGIRNNLIAPQTSHHTHNTEKSKGNKNNNNYIDNNSKSHKNAMSNVHSSIMDDDPFLPQKQIPCRGTTFRKQSLPTEELFGTRRPRVNRRSSLNPPSEYGRNSRKSSFAPVEEAEESHFLFDDDTAPRRKLWHRRHVLNARNGDDYFVPPSEKKESPERSLRARNKAGQRKRDQLLTNRKPEWKSYCENAITVNTSASRRNENSKSLTFNSRKSEAFSQNLKGKPSNSSRHCDTSSNSEESSDSFRNEYSKQRRKNSGLEEQQEPSNTTQWKGKSHRKSPKKGRRQTRDRLVNPMAKLTPMGLQSRGELFANKGCVIEKGLITQATPLVPYEPLVEKVTPTSPEAPPPHTGATRKQQSPRKFKKGRSSNRHDKRRSRTSISSSSSSSRSFLSSSSRDSSGDSRSSASSSSTSDSSSSSSSSSSESTSSSSSDSSDIEDLIL